MTDLGRTGFLVASVTVLLVLPAPARAAQAPPEPASLERDCGAGRGEACEALARMHVEGRAVPRDLQRAMAFHQKACDAGHLEGCRSLGVLLERTPGITPDPTRARSLFGKACDGGNAAACGNLAVQVEADDKDRALSLYVKGCDMGNALACLNGAHFLTWARSDPALRSKLLEKGCALDGGSLAAMACTNLAREREQAGTAAQHAAEATELRQRAVRLLEEACQANGWECRSLAAMYEQGDGAPRDAEKAALLWKRYADEVRRAADHDSHPGLYGELARLYAEGKGVARDDRRAQELREKAAAATRDLCERGLDSDSCFSLGRMYENGEGVEASPERAVAFYARACQAKHQMGCEEEKRLRQAGAPR